MSAQIPDNGKMELFPGFTRSPVDPSRDLRPVHQTPRIRSIRPPDAPKPFTRDTYRSECDQRWEGQSLRNARGNWSHWKSLHAELEKAMREYLRNPQQEDLTGKAHNPNGTLTDFLWTLQSAWQPNKACLAPFLDFCEHYQKVHLRRGLVIYCTMLLREIEAQPL